MKSSSLLNAVFVIFLVMAIIAILVGGAGIAALTLTASRLETALDDDAAELLLVEELETANEAAARTGRTYLLTRNPHYLDERRARTDEFRRLREQLAATLEDPEAMRILRRVDAHANALEAMWQRVVEDIESGAVHPGRLAGVLEHDVQPERDTLDAELGNLRVRVKAVLEQEQDNAETLARKSITLLAMLLGVTVMLSIVLGAGMRAAIRRERQVEASLREVTGHLQLALASGRVGVWRVNLRTGELFRDAGLNRMLGLPAEDSVVRVDASIVHSDDRERWMAAWQQALDGRAPLDLTLRIVRGDGELRWLRAVGSVLRDPDGTPAFFTGTATDVTAETQAGQEREMFLHALAHDLRNPTAGIKLAADVLLRRGGLDDAVARSVRTISSSSARMSKLIGQLLDFARSRAGAIPLHRQRVDLRELCMQVKAEVQLKRPDVPIDVEQRAGGIGQWDGDRLAQVLQNLVHNAIDHGAPGSAVRIAIDAEPGGMTQLTVANAGPAIPPDVLPHIFEPFRRGRAADGGLGLGLYIVHELVKAHGGTVDVESRDGETRFRVRLPGTIEAPADSGATLHGAI